MLTTTCEIVTYIKHLHLHLRPREFIESDIKAIISMVMNVFSMDSCIKHHLQTRKTGF